MGKEASENMASFASVAKSGTAFSPTREQLSDASPVLERQTDTLTGSDSHVKRKILCENRSGPEKIDSEEVASNDWTSQGSINLSHETVSCDLSHRSRQPSDDLLDQENGGMPDISFSGCKLSGKILNQNVKKLKRKYRKSGKGSVIKKARVDNSSGVGDSRNEDSPAEASTDWSIRSVCSESEPLPALNEDEFLGSSDNLGYNKQVKLLKR